MPDALVPSSVAELICATSTQVVVCSAQAHNGSGKTTCFVLAMLSRVDPEMAQPQALCVCPTRCADRSRAQQAHTPLLARGCQKPDPEVLIRTPCLPRCRELVAQNMMVLGKMAKHTRITATSTIQSAQFSRSVPLVLRSRLPSSLACMRAHC